MARHVNSQYTMFKRNLQNKFADRYRENKNIEYTDQDKTHLKLIIPDIPEPIIPKGTKFRNFSRRKPDPKPAKNPSLASFDQEYEAFVAALRQKNMTKAAEINNEVNEEITPVIHEPDTITESVIESTNEPVQDTQETTNDSTFDFFTEEKPNPIVTHRSIRRHRRQPTVQETTETNE